MTYRGRMSRLEQRLPAVDLARGYFVVGSQDQADELAVRYAAAGHQVPACLVTGIGRERPLWVPLEPYPGRQDPLREITDEELNAVLRVVTDRIPKTPEGEAFSRQGMAA